MRWRRWSQVRSPMTPAGPLISVRTVTQWRTFDSGLHHPTSLRLNLLVDSSFSVKRHGNMTEPWGPWKPLGYSSPRKGWMHSLSGWSGATLRGGAGGFVSRDCQPLIYFRIKAGVSSMPRSLGVQGDTVSHPYGRQCTMISVDQFVLPTWLLYISLGVQQIFPSQD